MKCTRSNCKKKVKRAGLVMPDRQDHELIPAIYNPRKKLCKDKNCIGLAHQLADEKSPTITPKTEVCESKHKTRTSSKFSIDDIGVITAEVESVGFPTKPEDFMKTRGIDKDKYTEVGYETTSWTTPMKIKNLEGEEIPTLVENFRVKLKLIPKSIDAVNFGLHVSPWSACDNPFHDNRSKVSDSDVHTVMVLPDIHFGYRVMNGKKVPTHDEKALNLVLQLIKHINPNQIIGLGDMMDFPQFGRHDHGIDVFGVAKDSVTAATMWLTKVRQTTNCPIDLVEGNHDARPIEYVREEMKKLAGVPGLEVKLPTLEEMLDLNGKNITYHGRDTQEGFTGYRRGSSFFKHRGVLYTHGEKCGKNAVEETMKQYMCSVVMGHIHKQTAESVMVPSPKENGEMGYRRVWAVSSGMLGRPDAVLPAATSIVNYQQGITLVTHVKQSNGTTNDFVVQIPIIDGQCLYDNQIFTSK